MAEKNSTIMASVWLEATNDFQQRIPNPTVQGLDATLGALFDPLNNDMWNYFVNALVMRIGMVRVRNQDYKNPLREFKGATMQYGHTIQEIAPKWIKGHAFSQASTLLDVNAPEAQEWFHSRNRQDMYPISINEVELRQSFDSEYGLSSLVAGFLNAPMNADEYDEYRVMLELIAYYQKHWGFYTIDLVNDPLTTEAGGKELLKQVRTLTGKMKVPSSRYNANVIDIPVFVSDPSELMLITIPECEANLDVEVLASLSMSSLPTSTCAESSWTSCPSPTPARCSPPGISSCATTPSRVCVPSRTVATSQPTTGSTIRASIRSRRSCPQSSSPTAAPRP